MKVRKDTAPWDPDRLGRRVHNRGYLPKDVSRRGARVHPVALPASSGESV